MEINFENKSVTGYQEFFRQTKRVQISIDSVVPDVNDDIGRIASVQSAVFLKSKEIAGRGAFVTGEVQASVLYITEGGSAVSCVKLTKEFDLDYEIGEGDESASVQIALSVVHAEARVLNPRKLSLTIETAGELSAFRCAETPVETLVPEAAAERLHVLPETAQTTMTAAVCEKSFVLNEQFPFPDGKPDPASLVSQEICYALSDTQQIGSRLIAKGTLSLAVCYLSEAEDYPIRTVFSAPFSQIVDLGCENCSCCTVRIETTSAYFDLIDSIGGGKSLDVELHAVMQVTARRQQELRCIADAYSNAMPLVCCRDTMRLPSVSEMQQAELSTDAVVVIAEDCEDILCVLPSLSSVTNDTEKLGASVALDVIYQGSGGELSSVRRSVTLEGAPLGADSRILSAGIREVSLYPEGSGLSGTVAVTLSYQSFGVVELSTVSGVSLREDSAFDQTALPSLSVVYTNGESLWELAKRYHSSVASIEAVNEAGSRVLLIPREV